MPRRPDPRLSIRDAAARLCVPDSTVRLWLDRGDLSGGSVPPDPDLRRVTPPGRWVSEASVASMLAARAARADVRLAVTVGALKGGAGKSTTVWCLACLLAAEGGRVLVVDTDANSQTLTQWANRYIAAGGKLPFEVLPWATNDLIDGIRRHLDGVDHLLIDTGPDGRDPTLLQAACAVAQVLVMPFAPRDIELVRVHATLEAARRGAALTGKPAWPLVLLNRTSLSRPSEQARARAHLAAAADLKDIVLDAEVRDLVVYTHMAAPLTTAQAGDYVGVLDELRAHTARIAEET